MKETIPTIYTHGKLILSVVTRGQGERLVSLTKKAGARGGTLLLGRGTSENIILSLFGLGDSEKDVVFSLITDEQVEPVLSTISQFDCRHKRHVGISMLMDVSHILQHIQPGSTVETQVNLNKERRKTMDSPHTLITFIVNKGYADDAMIAARKAGATGGTILNARGTGKEEDTKFFGVPLVPEKEMLMVLVGAGQTGAVLEAVRKIPCLSEPGAGIAFCMDVERFMTLGEKVKM